MAYTITKSDGTTLTTIADGTVDTSSTNLTLPGPNYVGYGAKLNENLVYLLENFAANSAPNGVNIQGQLWFNKSNQTMNVFTTQGYVPVSGIIVDPSQPVIGQTGTIWYNNNTNQIYVNNNGVYQLIAPLYTAQQGPSGAIPLVVPDKNVPGATHNIVELRFGNVTIATISSDTAFQPNVALNPELSGFSYINQGITLNANLTSTNLNSNLTGNVVGNLSGNVTGYLTGGVIGTFSGTASGTFAGASTGTFAGTSTGTFNGNASLTNASVTNQIVANFSSANVQLTGGNVIGMTSITGSSGQLTTFTATTLNATNGNLTSFNNITATNVTATTASTTNLSVNGTGNIATLNASTATVLTSTVANQTVANLKTANAQITGGAITTTPISGSTGVFTSLTTPVIVANVINAVTIGNTGANLVGTLSSGAQTSITGVGTLTSGTWNASIVGPVYGGTGVNNGAYTITLGGSYLFNQNVAANTSPTFKATNITGIAPSLQVATANVAAQATTATLANVAVAANTVTTTNFTMYQSGSKLYFAYNGTPLMSLDSSGNFTVLNNISGYTSP